MTLSFRHPSASGEMTLPDELLSFVVWLAANRNHPAAISYLCVLAEYQHETPEERENIKRTLAELLEGLSNEQR